MNLKVIKISWDALIIIVCQIGGKESETNHAILVCVLLLPTSFSTYNPSDYIVVASCKLYN